MSCYECNRGESVKNHFLTCTLQVYLHRLSTDDKLAHMVLANDHFCFDLFNESLPIWPEHTKRDRLNCVEKYKQQFYLKVDAYKSVSSALMLCVFKAK